MQTTILPSANPQHLVQHSVLPFAKAPFHKRAINAATIALAGGAVTAGLFVLMTELIRQDKVNISEAPPVFFEPIIYKPKLNDGKLVSQLSSASIRWSGKDTVY